MRWSNLTRSKIASILRCGHALGTALASRVTSHRHLVRRKSMSGRSRVLANTLGENVERPDHPLQDWAIRSNPPACKLLGSRALQEHVLGYWTLP